MSIWEFCIRRPVFTIMLVSAPVVMGLASYFRLGVDLFPNVDLPVVVVTTTLKGAGLRALADLRNEKITYKIREHSLQKLPYQLIIGDKEAQAKTVAVRSRGGEDLGSMPVDALLARLREEVAARR